MQGIYPCATAVIRLYVLALEAITQFLFSRTSTELTLKPRKHDSNTMQPPSEWPEQQPYNLNNELAKERTRAAADRTLMAWIRTSLSLIGFGFGIPTIVRTLEATRIGEHINPHHLTNTVGLSFIGVGMFAMAAALKEHRRMLKRLQSDRFIYETSKTAELVGIALLLVGLVSFIGVLIKAVVL